MLMTQTGAAVLYIGLHVLLLLVLKINVGRVRTREKVAFGTGDNQALERAIRVQGNAVEDVPIILLGVIGLAMLSASVYLIHAIGALLLVSRILHATGLSKSAGTTPGRMVGTIGTALCYLLTAGGCLGAFFL